MRLNAVVPPHVFLATPCYGGVVTHRYFHSVLALMLHGAAQGLPVHVETLARESLIPRGRNSLAAKFLAHPQATHLLFVDADIGFAPEAVLRLLAFGVDVVAGMYPLKAIEWDAGAAARARAGELISTAPLRYVGRPCEVGAARDGFVPAEYAGTGFMLVRREVFMRVAAAYPGLEYAAAHDGDGSVPGPFHAFFDCEIDPETRHYLSEDYAFCRRWRAIGGEIWLDTQAVLTHTGVHEFVGAPGVRFGPGYTQSRGL